MSAAAPTSSDELKTHDQEYARHALTNSKDAALDILAMLGKPDLR